MPKKPASVGPCTGNGFGSAECDRCVNAYANDHFGYFGGFIANAFNAQQMIPGLSGKSLHKTIEPAAELGAAKLGASQALKHGGNFIAMNTSSSAGFWAGTSMEYAGAALVDVLGVIGVLTTPYATTATAIARSNCGG